MEEKFPKKQQEPEEETAAVNSAASSNCYNYHKQLYQRLHSDNGHHSLALNLLRHWQRQQAIFLNILEVT